MRADGVTVLGTDIDDLSYSIFMNTIRVRIRKKILLLVGNPKNRENNKIPQQFLSYSRPTKLFSILNE